MSTSKLQRRVSELLSVHLGQHTIRENVRPSWLITEPGERLELDFFIEEINVAFEVQGEQHYRFVEFFHNDGNGFLAQLERDRLKRKLCKDNGTKLFEIGNEFDALLSIQSLIDMPQTIKEAHKLADVLGADINLLECRISRLKRQYQLARDVLDSSIAEKKETLAALKRHIKMNKD